MDGPFKDIGYRAWATGHPCQCRAALRCARAQWRAPDLSASAPLRINTGDPSRGHVTGSGKTRRSMEALPGHRKSHRRIRASKDRSSVPTRSAQCVAFKPSAAWSLWPRKESNSRPRVNTPCNSGPHTERGGARMPDLSPPAKTSCLCVSLSLPPCRVCLLCGCHRFVL